MSACAAGYNPNKRKTEERNTENGEGGDSVFGAEGFGIIPEECELSRTASRQVRRR